MGKSHARRNAILAQESYIRSGGVTQGKMSHEKTNGCIDLRLKKIMQNQGTSLVGGKGIHSKERG